MSDMQQPWNFDPHYTATCNPPCQNGGTCTSPGVCHCTASWNGSRCQQGTSANI